MPTDQTIPQSAQEVINIAKAVRREINHPTQNDGKIQPEDFEIVFTKAVEAVLKTK